MKDQRNKTISGFSRLSKEGKLKWVVDHYADDPSAVMRELKSFWLEDPDQQKILDDISENTISNFFLPYSVIPNFVMNDETLCIPMVTEESSVVAAAASSAKFWMERGGFKATVVGTIKQGHVHFFWHGRHAELSSTMPRLKEFLLGKASDITKNMALRGGGVLDIVLLDKQDLLEDYYQLEVSFETCDSMGANFMNSVLECFAGALPEFFNSENAFHGEEQDVEVLMAILSNYAPQCIVRASVSCPVQDMGNFRGELNSATFTDRFHKAVLIAKKDPYRAVTHNKGIFNGIDAIALATANDFRAIEAGAHCYASRTGVYRSLSDCSITDGIFHFWLEIPLSVGTIGGLTALHPVAKHSFELLGHPDARKLMMIIASIGLAQNFAALRSLVTTGIQYGHMKMHLSNILHSLHASEEEKLLAKKYFDDKVISYQAVQAYLDALRSLQINLTEDDIQTSDAKQTQATARKEKTNN